MKGVAPGWTSLSKAWMLWLPCQHKHCEGSACVQSFDKTPTTNTLYAWNITVAMVTTKWLPLPWGPSRPVLPVLALWPFPWVPAAVLAWWPGSALRTWYDSWWESRSSPKLSSYHPLVWTKSAHEIRVRMQLHILTGNTILLKWHNKNVRHWYGDA